jgi:hypothetical protein
MKTKIWFLSLSLVFSGCYSYKQLDRQSESFLLGDRYQLTTASDHKWQGKVIQVTDSLITLQTNSGQRIDFPSNQLNAIQQREVSVGKTIALTLSLVGLSVGIAAICIRDATPSWNNYNFFDY